MWTIGPTSFLLQTGETKASKVLSSLSDMRKIFLVKGKFMTIVYSNSSVLMGIGKKGKSNLKFI